MTASPIVADKIQEDERSSTVMDQPWMPSEGGIATYHTFVPPPLPTAPSFHLHLTRLRDTLFIWVGTGSEGSGEDVAEETASVGEKRLAADWAVAMPTRGNIPATATPLYTSGASGVSLAMSQRLAKRFPDNQIHLSLSLSASLTPTQGSSLDPFASKVLLVMEKKLGAWLTEIISQES